MERAVEETVKAVSSSAMDSTAPAEKQSKNALKKELKNKQREETRHRKEEEKAAMQAAAAKTGFQNKKSVGAEDEDMDPTQYYENRLKFLAAQKAEGKNPYPHKFSASLSIDEYIDKYGGLDNGEQKEDVTDISFGRIMSKRSFGSKLFFYDLHRGDAKVQVMADARCWVEAMAI